MLKVLPLLFLISLSGCVTYYNPVLEREEKTLISESMEIRLGRIARGSLEKEYRVHKSPRLWEIGEKIARVSHRPYLPYEFKEMEEKRVNAISFPGGFIYVTSGLLRMADENELAGVLSHEIAHVNLRHGVKKLQSYWGYTFLSSLLFSREKEELLKWADTAYRIISLGYSRRDELEADRLGTYYLEKAGYPTEGLLRFLKKLQKKEKINPFPFLVILSSHPSLEERIEKLESILEKGERK